MTTYNYNGKEPLKIAVEDLNDKHKELIFENKSFCMYPWIHLHAFPPGEAYPCCNTDMYESIGNTRQSTLKEIWHGKPLQDIRNKMLSGETVEG